MFTVEVEKECGCFRRSEYQKEKSFDTRDEAFLYSKALEELMNEEFCGKHRFIAKELSDTEFMVRVGDNPKGGGCCGGGHCG
jgi:hypothetical protein